MLFFLTHCRICTYLYLKLLNTRRRQNKQQQRAGMFLSSAAVYCIFILFILSGSSRLMRWQRVEFCLAAVPMHITDVLLQLRNLLLAEQADNLVMLLVRLLQNTVLVVRILKEIVLADKVILQALQKVGHLRVRAAVKIDIMEFDLQFIIFVTQSRVDG